MAPNRKPAVIPPGESNLVGYARVSTLDQNPQLQVDELAAAGCSRIFTDQRSGSRADRPELAAALDYLRSGDTLVVWRLDRLGRSLKHLIEVVVALDERGVAFKSLREGFDTSTAGGRLIFHVFGALAEFERELIQERTAAGLAAARARGRVGGRPTVMTPDRIAIAETMRAETDDDGQPVHRVEDIAAALTVSPASVYRALGTSK